MESDAGSLARHNLAAMCIHVSKRQAYYSVVEHHELSSEVDLNEERVLTAMFLGHLKYVFACFRLVILFQSAKCSNYEFAAHFCVAL